MSSYLKTNHIDNFHETRKYEDEKLKGKKLSKKEFSLGEKVEKDDEAILLHLGLAVSKDKYDAKRKTYGLPKRSDEMVKQAK